jgi:hypothetical protein
MSDLQSFGPGPVTPAGRTAYDPGKFKPRRAHRRTWDKFDPAGSPWDQQHSGDTLNRGSKAERDERIRPDGVLLSYQLYPEQHRLLVDHPQWETRFNADGTREFYCVKAGEIKCTCGGTHEQYVQPWEEEPEPGETSGWDAAMLLAAGIDISQPAREATPVPEQDWWSDDD